MTLGPTPTQWRVLGYLRQFHAEEDRLPTMDEIARQFGWASSTAALDHMRGLERKGWLDKRGCRWRFARPACPADLRDEALELEIKAAGLRLYNEAILVTAIGSLPIRVGRQFEAGRKLGKTLGKTHQNVLVFVKGCAKRATEAVGPVEFGDIGEGEGQGEAGPDYTPPNPF